MTVLDSSESFWKLVILSLGTYYFQIRTTTRIDGNVFFLFEIHMCDLNLILNQTDVFSGYIFQSVKSKNIQWKHLLHKIKYVFLRDSYVCPRWIFIFISNQAQINSALGITFFISLRLYFLTVWQVEALSNFSGRRGGEGRGGIQTQPHPKEF